MDGISEFSFLSYFYQIVEVYFFRLIAPQEDLTLLAL